MRKHSGRLIVVIALLAVGCGDDRTTAPASTAAHQASDAGTSVAALREKVSEMFGSVDSGSIPQDGTDALRFSLGRKLFFEQRVSADGQIACASCHVAAHGGGDGLAVSVGVFGRANPRNAPTVFNAGLQPFQHWRADRMSLADQAARSPLGMTSFGNQEEMEAMGRLRDAGYEDEFERAFPGEQPALSLDHFGSAVASFEQTLSTPGRIDAFLNGDDSALTSDEQAGLSAFVDLGCAGCHNGPGFGGQMLQKFGVVEPYADATGSAMPDQGRFDVTQDEADRFVFKVPMLRNVGESAPYFHDGSAAELDRAVRVMARVQLGSQLTDTQVAILVAFLRALSGPVPDWFSAP
jgi:cytochrome c peroxidase